MRRRVAAIACLIFAVASAGIVWSAPAVAAENATFGVAPYPAKVRGVERRTFEVPLEEGAVFRDRARIYNRTGRTIELAVYSVDAETAPDGQISVGFRASKATGVGAWVSLSNRRVRLAPHAERIVTIEVQVRSDQPSPDLGAVVVEDTSKGGGKLGQRLHVLVRTAPSGTPTAAVRAPRGIRSLWWVGAFVGLLLAAFVVWWRATRTTKDSLVEPGDLALPRPDLEDVGARPPTVLHLGQREAEPDERDPNSESDELFLDVVVRAGRPGPRRRAPAPKPQRIPARTAAAKRSTAKKTTARKTSSTVPARRAPRAKRPARRAAGERNFIPLDEL